MHVISCGVALLLVSSALGVLPPKSGCPDESDIKPCKCTNSPFTYLECQHIDDSEVLRTVFDRSARHEFNEVHIKYSVLQFLPRDMFEKVRVKALYLKNVTLSQLFDAPPYGLDKLDKLHIEASKLLRGLMVEFLKPMTQLRILTIYYNSVRTLGPEHTFSLSKGIEQLIYYDTSTKLIKPGTFAEHTSLDRFSLDAGKLTQITRDIFPVPFNGRYLYFNKNQLTSIPEDMFTNMPNLQTVGLKDNQIAVLPATAFGKSWAKLDFLMLEGNPLICDCRMNWLIKRKPPALSGHCTLPTSAKGKQLKDLPEDFLDC